MWNSLNGADRQDERKLLLSIKWRIGMVRGGFEGGASEWKGPVTFTDIWWSDNVHLMWWSWWDYIQGFSRPWIRDEKIDKGSYGTLHDKRAKHHCLIKWLPPTPPSLPHQKNKAKYLTIMIVKTSEWHLCLKVYFKKLKVKEKKASQFFQHKCKKS